LAAAGVLLAGLLATLATVGFVVAAPAGAATTSSAAKSSSADLYIAGAGNGHGVGMSQFGAAGYAEHGSTYREILRDYYAQTTLGTVDPGRIVTVQLRANGAAAFAGATKITGSTLKLDAARNYTVVPVHGKLLIRSGGHKFGVYPAPLQVSGPGPVRLYGLGLYRGALVFRPAVHGGGVAIVNALGVDDYVRGVISAEMPSDWPAQALEAQAVAARTYAITDGAVNPDFGLYDNTRSQMYKGVAAETPATDAAVAATAGQVVEYDGNPVVTYFFASSGGRTESVQNVFSGIAAEPWLVGRPDPYDDSFNNPYFHWNRAYSVSAAAAKLKAFVHGTFEGIKVVQHGVSPRVVSAQVVGSQGDATVSGTQLQTAFGTPSTWMRFTTLSVEGVRSAGPSRAPTGPSTAPAAPSNGGAGLGASARGHRHVVPAYTVAGTVFPAAVGAAVSVQAETAGGWAGAGSSHVAASGAYSVSVRGPGTYRVLYNSIVGPTVVLRR